VAGRDGEEEREEAATRVVAAARVARMRVVR